MKRLVVALVAATALVGCGGNEDDDAVGATVAPAAIETTPSPTPTPEAPRSLDSVYDLRAAVERAGYECSTDFEVIAEPVNAIERASCGEHVVLSIHTDASQAQRSVEELAPLLNEFGFTSVHLTGPQWSVNCGDDVALCEQFQEVLGGEVQVFEGAS